MGKPSDGNRPASPPAKQQDNVGNLDNSAPDGPGQDLAAQPTARKTAPNARQFKRRRGDKKAAEPALSGDSTMVPMTNHHDVSGVIKFLEDNKVRGEEVSLGDVMRLAEVMAGDFKSFLHSYAPSMRQEFEDIASEIARMKQEVTHLRAADMKHNRIPEAGRELDAIVEATEEATQTIMAAAEEIMAADSSDADAYQAMVGDKMIEIFEACAFQDITGQRISKVVKTLSFIDERVSNFVERLRIMENEEGELEETDDDRRRRELILHGPQHTGEGVSQDEIDAMLNGSDQADIDKLFD